MKGLRPQQAITDEASAVLDLTGSESNVSDLPDTSDPHANAGHAHVLNQAQRPVRTQRRGKKTGHRQPKPKLQSGTIGVSNTENARRTLDVASRQRRPLTKHEKQLVAAAQGTLARRANEGKTRSKRKAARQARRKNR